MAGTKTYLNVPYAQKDEAKALGARWDPANKKWYVPAGKDIAPFAQWHMEEEAVANFSAANAQVSAKPAHTSNNSAGGIFTHPTITNFEPYSGNEAPWD